MRLWIANKNYSSWSLRPWVLMRELGIEFEERLQPFGRNADEIRELFRQFSPSGKVPCLQDGDITVWDSLAITEYLAETHPAVWPLSREARAWARSAAAEMHSGFTALRQHCSMTCGQRITLRERPPELLTDLARLQELWSAGLARFGGPFLAGANFTAVDAFFAPVAFRLQSYQISLNEHCNAYRDRLLALPAMREWYEAALAEPWREAAHELDIAAGASEIVDLRRPA